MFNKRFPKSISHLHRKEDSKEEGPEEAKKIKFNIDKFFADTGAPECAIKLHK